MKGTVVGWRFLWGIMDGFWSLAVALGIHVVLVAIFVAFGCANKKSKKDSDPRTALESAEAEPKQLNLAPAGIQPPQSAPNNTQIPSTKQSSTTGESEAAAAKQAPTKSAMTEDKKPATITPQQSGKVTTGKNHTVEVSKESKSDAKNKTTGTTVRSQTPTTGGTKSKMHTTDVNETQTQKTDNSNLTDLRTPAWMETEEYVQHKLEVQKQLAAGVH